MFRRESVLDSSVLGQIQAPERADSVFFISIAVDVVIVVMLITVLVSLIVKLLSHFCVFFFPVDHELLQVSKITELFCSKLGRSEAEVHIVAIKSCSQTQ